MFSNLTPQAVSSAITVAVGAASWLIGRINGDKIGQDKVRNDYVQEIEKASAFVIHELTDRIDDLKALERDCRAKHEECETKVAHLSDKLETVFSALPLKYRHLNG